MEVYRSQIQVIRMYRFRTDKLAKIAKSIKDKDFELEKCIDNIKSLSISFDNKKNKRMIKDGCYTLSLTQLETKINVQVKKKKNIEEKLDKLRNEYDIQYEYLNQIYEKIAERGIELHDQEKIEYPTMKEKIDHFSRFLINNSSLVSRYEKDLETIRNRELPDEVEQLRLLLEYPDNYEIYHDILESTQKIIVLYLCSIEKDPVYYINTINVSKDINYFDSEKCTYVFDKDNIIHIDGISRYIEKFKMFKQSPYNFLTKKVSKPDLGFYMNYFVCPRVIKTFTMTRYEHGIPKYTSIDNRTIDRYQEYIDNLSSIKNLEHDLRALNKTIMNTDEYDKSMNNLKKGIFELEARLKVSKNLI